MDFEWEKLINGESDIDADDINALADGIIENEKEIKAIKDIMNNGGTIPEYLTDFFKEIPEGMSIDDLNNSLHLGCYIGKETQIVYQVEYEVRYILFIDEGLYVNNDVGRDEVCHFQTKYYLDAKSGKTKIKQRRHGLNEYDSYVWFDWEDCFEPFGRASGGGGELETIATVNIEEEINDITISADSQGNPFELKELFAYIQIPTVADGIQPIIYFGSENSCNRTLDNLTNDSYIVIRWRREEGIAEIQVYNYGTKKFKTLTILNVADTNIVNKLRLYHKTKFYPIGTSIVLKGKKV